MAELSAAATLTSDLGRVVLLLIAIAGAQFLVGASLIFAPVRAVCRSLPGRTGKYATALFRCAFCLGIELGLVMAFCDTLAHATQRITWLWYTIEGGLAGGAVAYWFDLHTQVMDSPAESRGSGE